MMMMTAFENSLSYFRHQNKSIAPWMSNLSPYLHSCEGERDNKKNFFLIIYIYIYEE